MTYVSVLQNVETLAQADNEKVNALNTVLEQEYALFALMVNYRHGNENDSTLSVYFEGLYSKFFKIFESVSGIIKNEDGKALPMVVVPEAEWNSKLIFEILRVNKNIQAELKNMIAIKALFSNQPEVEEALVSIVETHEEMGALIERTLK